MKKIRLLISVAIANLAYAVTVNDIADNIIGQLGAAKDLVIYGAYSAGLGFLVATFYKFKQHKDNPTQVPIGNPITMLAIAVLLLFLGNLIQPIGETLFGNPITSGADVV